MSELFRLQRCVGSKSLYSPLVTGNANGERIIGFFYLCVCMLSDRLRNIDPMFAGWTRYVEASDVILELLHAADVPQQLIDVAIENDVLDELVESVLGDYVSDNVLEVANTASNTHYLKACKALNIDPHPARFPRQLPEFFIKFLTDPDDLVLDIFAGSNTTGRVAEELGRKWLAFETQEAYLATSQLRFKDWEMIEDLANRKEDIGVAEVEPADD